MLFNTDENTTFEKEMRNLIDGCLPCPRPNAITYCRKQNNCDSCPDNKKVLDKIMEIPELIEAIELLKYYKLGKGMEFLAIKKMRETNEYK